MRKWVSSIIPKGILWRLTILNVFVIAVAILLSGWAIYETACFLVDGMGSYSIARQERFNATLFQYVLLFTGLGVFVSSVVHFYFTKRLIRPINELIEATKMLKDGKYAKPLQVRSNDEIGELISHHNELIDQLQKHEQLRKKLVDDLSHELRTPIANVKGYLFALKSGDIVGDTDLYHSLYDQTEQLAKLIEQIERFNEWNNIASQKSLKKEQVQIRDVILHSVQMFDWKLEQAGLCMEVDVEDVEITVHVEGIQQVLNNLLDNAIRYYQGEGAISVIGTKMTTAYCVSITSPGEQINENVRKKIFDRFYRMESSRNRQTGGSGLGLAIAKEIIENHQGTMEVISNNGENTFSFKIPI